jgi:hypothetical protein
MSLTKQTSLTDAERRSTRRHPTIRSAVMSFESDCAVFDLSERGARILLRGPMTLPETFKLSIDAGPPINCRVTWRKSNEIGVEFIGLHDNEDDTAEEEEDARRATREKIFDRAVIVYNDGFCTMDCQVIDYSEIGARLKPLNPHDCPNHFQLRIAHGPTRNCVVLRRFGHEVGVRFLPD